MERPKLGGGPSEGGAQRGPGSPARCKCDLEPSNHTPPSLLTPPPPFLQWPLSASDLDPSASLALPVQIGVSVEPVAAIADKEVSRVGSRLDFARRVAVDLFRYIGTLPAAVDSRAVNSPAAQRPLPLSILPQR